MSGGAPKTKVRTIWLGMHHVFGLGPIDGILEILYDKKVAWSGWCTGGRINVDAENLFGGYKQEGGVKGAFDFLAGRPDQGRNDYLQSQLGEDIPAYRGVWGLVARRVYFGLSPYLKPLSVRPQRIHVRGREGLPQWYDEKAAIPFGAQIDIGFDDAGQKYRVELPGSTADYSAADYDDSAWDTGAGAFGNLSYGAETPAINTHVDPGIGKAIWIRRHVGGSDWNVHVDVFHDDGATFWWNGELIPLEFILGDALHTGNSIATVPRNKILSANVAVLKVVDSVPTGTPTAICAAFKLTSAPLYDMNPAHILRECCTDKDFGRGANETTGIDNDSFTAAADTLYDEGFGLSVHWKSLSDVEGFAKEILAHIDGVLYRNEFNRWVLKLARADYDPADLLLLDDDDILDAKGLRRTQPGELVNSITVQSYDRSTRKASSITVKNDVLIDLQGAEVNEVRKYPAIARNDLRNKVALRDLKARSTPLLFGPITAKRKAAALNPGGLFRLTRAEAGISEVVMRVLKISKGSSSKSAVHIECVEDIYSFPDVNLRGTPSGGWTDPVSAPTASPSRAVEEAPYLELVRRQGQQDADSKLAYAPEAGWLAVAAQQPSGDAINAGLNVDAGAGYSETGTIDFTPVAVLAAGIGRLEESATVTDGSVFEDIEAGSLMLLDEEFVRFDGLAGSVVSFGRGVLDTVPVEHVAGARLWAVEDHWGTDAVQYLDGEILAVKVTPATGAGELDIALAPPDSLALNQRAIRPYPPADVRLNGASFPSSVMAPVEVTWVTRNRLQQTGATLLDWFDGPVTPESGQTTTIRLLRGATVLETWSGETDGTVTLATNATGTYNLEATSQRDGYDSFQTFTHEFRLIGSDALMTASGEVLETADGQILTE